MNNKQPHSVAFLSGFGVTWRSQRDVSQLALVSTLVQSALCWRQQQP